MDRWFCRRAVACIEALEPRQHLSVTLTTLAAFKTAGDQPAGAVTLDASGNLFGLANTAKDASYLYKLAAGSGQITPTASFTEEAGSDVYRDSSGNLFGTVYGDGSSSFGQVFEQTAAGKTSTITTFDSANGFDPSGVIADSSGNVYGSTLYGGNYSSGNLYKINANAGKPTSLFSFSYHNGAMPIGNVVLDSSGNLYGVTYQGGSAGDGTVFKLSAGSNQLTTLVNFNGPNGALPPAGLLRDSNGNLFGVTSAGGEFGFGTIFQITAAGAFSTLVSFPGNVQTLSQSGPQAALLEDTKGDLFGTTYQGGANGDGTVFELPAGSNALSTLITFNGSNGAYPDSRLVVDAQGTLYGTAAGKSGVSGTVFKVTGSGFVGASAGKITYTAPAGQTATAGAAKSFSLGSFSQTGTAGPYPVTVNWGDGSSATHFNQSSSGTLSGMSHTFSAAGTDTVTMTITDAKDDTTATGSFKITVSPAPGKLVFAKSPGTTTAGKAISPALVVKVENAQGQVMTGDSSTVMLAIASGPSGAALGGTISEKAVRGVATFSNVLLTKAGSYMLRAVDGSLNSATTAAFSIAAATASKLVFSQQPQTSKAGKAITPAVTVLVEDSYGNVVTTDKSTVKISISSGPGGSTVTGTTSAAASAGIAKFSNLVLNKSGSYKLKASDGSLVTVVSNAFTVS